MTTIAIIGAGNGLGISVARRFGREGMKVALMARTQSTLDQLTRDLQADGVTARAYPTDVRDRAALVNALRRAEEELGHIEVLQYSPVPAREFMKEVLATTADDLVGPLDLSILGPVAAVQQVLPGMRERGHGTILFVNGSSAVRPNATVTGTSVAFAGESAYAELLHQALAAENIRVGQLIIPRGIGNGEPSHEPAALADRLWAIHSEGGPFRHYAADLDSEDG